jgi:glycerol-3-phosphate acyltransferase PlsY
MWSEIVLIVAAYLLGSVPHLTLLARLRHVRLSGDFHKNLWKRAGRTATVIGILGEFVKGALPVLAGRWLGFGPLTLTTAGVAAVGGQMWPVFRKFDGEKGNSIAVAMIAALAPPAALVAFIFPAIALVVRTFPRLTAGKAEGRREVIGGPYSRSLPVGMALLFLAMPFTSWFFGEPAPVVWGTAVLFVLIILRRLTAGLRADLKTGRDVWGIVLRRVLYDRAAGLWRL